MNSNYYIMINNYLNFLTTTRCRNVNPELYILYYHLPYQY